MGVQAAARYVRRLQKADSGDTCSDSGIGGAGTYCSLFWHKMLYDDVLSEGGSLHGQILFVILVMAAFSLLSTGFSMIYGVIISRITPQVIHKLRTDIFASMQKLSLSFFTTKQTGSLMGRVDRDSFDVYGFSLI